MRARVQYRATFPFTKFFSKTDPDNFRLHPDYADTFLNMLASQKSPGSPLCYDYSNNASLLASFKSEFIFGVNDMLTQWHKLGAAVMAADDRRSTLQELFCYSDFDREAYDVRCMEYMSQGYTHPILLKKKGELRKVGKNPRLVCQVSAVWNTAERVVEQPYLFDEQQRSNLTTATALDITTPDETQKLFERFHANAPLLSSDVQGFEYSATPVFNYAAFVLQAYQMHLISDFDCTVVPGNEKHFYTFLGKTILSLHRVLQTEDGGLYTAPPGLITSGALDTFSKNSKIRVAQGDYISHVLGLPLTFALAAGDDHLDAALPQVEDPAAVLIAAYARIGIVITDVAIQKDVFSFCSTTFSDGLAYQDNITKAAAHVIWTPKDPQEIGELLAGFRLSSSRHPEYTRYASLVNENLPLKGGR